MTTGELPPLRPAGETDGRPKPNNPALLSSTACHRCRRQKLKCSRDLPVCHRCQKFHTSCTYPTRLDRRRRNREIEESPGSSNDASRRAERGHVGESHEFPSSSNVVEYRETAPTPLDNHQNEERDNSPEVLVEAQSGCNWANVSTEMYPSHLRNVDRSTARADHTDATDSSLPPLALGLSLLEIYFSRIYNAPILFCKPLLFQDFLAGTIPGFLLKALFAVATLFLNSQKDGVTDVTKLSELNALSSFRDRGPTWARIATEEAMSLMATNPSLPACQALESLQIYWFGIGNSKVGDLCIALAYRCCSISGYNQYTPDGCAEAALLLTSELQRRCFWACWTSVCIAGEPTPYVKSAWSEASNVPLPARIVSSLSGWRIKLTERMDENWSPVLLNLQHEDVIIPTAAAELMKMVGIWAKIQLFARSCPKNVPRSKLDEMLALAELATSTYEKSATSAYRLALRGVGDPADARHLELFDALYHLGQMTLHSKVVPFFSGRLTESSISAEVSRNSAKSMLHHADLYAKLLSTYLDGTHDATYLCPLVGFGAFVAASVFLAVETFAQRRELNDSRQGLEVDAKRNRVATLKAIICLLDTLRQYWKALQAPFDRLYAAVQASPYQHLCLREARSPITAGTEITPVDLSASAQANASEQRGLSRVGYNFSHDSSIQSLPHQQISLATSTYRSYQPTTSHIFENGNQIFQRPEIPLGPMPSLQLDIMDDDWWNLPLNSHGNGFDGFEWFNFSNSESWSYMT